MKAGKLDTRITILAKSYVDDGTGCGEESWAEMLTTWGQIVEAKGASLTEAQRVLNYASLRLRIRYRDGITTDMRVRIGEREYEITSLPPLGGRDYLALDLREAPLADYVDYGSAGGV